MEGDADLQKFRLSSVSLAYLILLHKSTNRNQVAIGNKNVFIVDINFDLC